MVKELCSIDKASKATWQRGLIVPAALHIPSIRRHLHRSSTRKGCKAMRIDKLPGMEHLMVICTAVRTTQAASPQGAWPGPRQTVATRHGSTLGRVSAGVPWTKMFCGAIELGVLGGEESAKKQAGARSRSPG